MDKETKIKEYRHCKKCGKKLDLDDLAKRGYIEKVSPDIVVIYCPFCGNEEML